MGQPQLISTKSTSVWVDNNSAHRVIVSGNEPQICRKDICAVILMKLRNLCLSECRDVWMYVAILTNKLHKQGMMLLVDKVNAQERRNRNRYISNNHSYISSNK